METIEENSVLLNWNDGSESINPTLGDTTVITKKDDSSHVFFLFHFPSDS